MSEPDVVPAANPNQKGAQPLVQLPMADGVKVSLPQPLHNLTTYVVREQGDWFEDEIKFLRRYLKPGMRVVDIGANYGMYSLSMAKTVGAQGMVWAFEPASRTAEILDRSIRANRFSQVKLIRKGLSDHIGKAAFNLADNAELNSLGPVARSIGSETVDLTTFDQWIAEEKPAAIHFIKLDAEGEEGRILDGAAAALADMSPLVMFELKHAKQVNLPLIQRFARLGFTTYRLIPGISKLVPFDPASDFDPYLLNLFACKDDMADRLFRQNILVRQEDTENVSRETDDALSQSLISQVQGVAHRIINGLPFAEKVANVADWQPGSGGEFEQMLDCYIAARSAKLKAKQRWQLLRVALSISRRLTRNGAGHPNCPIEQAASHARLARDAGEQNRAVQILRQAIGANEGVTGLELKLPFIPAVARYDRLNPEDRLNRWLVSSLIEQYVRDNAYSTYSNARSILPALQRLNTLGFISHSMRRRFNLVSSLKFGE